MEAVARGPQWGLTPRHTLYAPGGTLSAKRNVERTTAPKTTLVHPALPYLGVQAGHLGPQLSVALLRRRGLQGSGMAGGNGAGGKPSVSTVTAITCLLTGYMILAAFGVLLVFGTAARMVRRTGFRRGLPLASARAWPYRPTQVVQAPYNTHITGLVLKRHTRKAVPGCRSWAQSSVAYPTPSRT